MQTFSTIASHTNDKQSQFIELLVQQNQMLTQLLTQQHTHGDSTKQTSASTVKQTQPNTKLHFTKKELQMRPILKDFSIRTRNNGSIELRYRKNGYQVSFCGRTFDEAKEKAYEWIALFNEQLHNNTRCRVLTQAETKRYERQASIKFGPFADEYMQNVKKKMVKEKSFKSLMNTYKNHIIPYYANCRLKDITAKMLQPHFNKLHDEIPRVCEDVKTLMTGILEYAVNNGLLSFNPMKAVFVPKHERTKGVALTYDEELQFVKAIKGNYYEYSFLRMLYCGVRACEVNEVEENLEDNTLTIKNGKLKSYQKVLYRTVPMFPYYKQNVVGRCKRVDVKHLSMEFSKLCPGHTLKDLRHTFTTRARECGIDNEIVSLWTGHSLGNVTASVYTHFNMRFQQKQAEKLVYYK